MTTTPRPLSYKFTEALLFANELHGRQRRKGGIPFMAHLLGVTSIVLEDGSDEEVGIAALLHDAVEDQPRGGITEKEILDRFGERVHRIVLGCTDTDPAGTTQPWETRKQGFIARLRVQADADVLRVTAADKLYNARSIVNDMRVIGDAVWQRFSVPREKTIWYYVAVTAALESALAGIPSAPKSPARIINELRGVVKAMERGVEQK
ncbi:MAG TPA: HD domain-containing protein [Gemmatimonadales bacterium]|nr:HD domain-containing protein [Gemmatimonadales bacterium]